MTMRSFEERVRVRLLMEADVTEPVTYEGCGTLPSSIPIWADEVDYLHVSVEHAARVAAREHQDMVDPLSHRPRTAVLRPAMQPTPGALEALAHVVAMTNEETNHG